MRFVGYIGTVRGMIDDASWGCAGPLPGMRLQMKRKKESGMLWRRRMDLTVLRRGASIRGLRTGRHDERSQKNDDWSTVTTGLLLIWKKERKDLAVLRRGVSVQGLRTGQHDGRGWKND